MDGVTNDYGCGNRRKSGTVGYLLNQSSAEYFDYRGREASRPRRFFLATSLSSGWLGKQATFSIGKIPINNRPEWWGRRPPLLQWKGGNRRFTAAPLQLTTFRPTWSRTKTENCVDRRTKPTHLSWSERLKKENGGPFRPGGIVGELCRGQGVRTFRWLRPLSVGSFLDMEIDPERYIEKWILLIWFQDLWTREREP